MYCVDLFGAAGLSDGLSVTKVVVAGGVDARELPGSSPGGRERGLNYVCLEDVKVG